MDWTQFGIAFAALAGGCVLRAFIPYILGGLQAAGEEGWEAWPPFEAKYVTTFVAAIILYGIALLTVPGAAEMLAQMSLVPAVALGYSGGDLVRTGAKTIFPKAR